MTIVLSRYGQVFEKQSTTRISDKNLIHIFL